MTSFLLPRPTPARRARRRLAVLATGLCAALLPVAGPARSATGPEAPAPGRAQAGYWLVASDGGIFSFGDAPFYGSTGAIRLNQPIVGMAATPGGNGYWLVASDGGMFSFGDAGFFGSTGSMRLNRPIVGMAPTASGRGYWLVASDGGMFSFGDAGFFGSTGSITLNQPIVGMAPTPSGAGYWLVASDGGVFSFGDATFHGAAGAAAAGDRVVGLRPTPSGRGYWQALASGRALAFGDATDMGSAAAGATPVVGMTSTPSGTGYWLVRADGGVFAFGDAQFLGSPGVRLNQPVVGLAVRARPGAGPSPATGFEAPPAPAPSAPGTPAIPGPTPPVTAPPSGPRSHPSDPDGSAPEVIATAMKSPYGGTSYLDVSPIPNDCGFPELASRTVLPDETDFIGEASGMAASRRHPGVFWVVRDSGHTPAINAVRILPDGMVTTREIMVEGAVNGDWEEVNYTIGRDGVARLWVVDNGGKASKKVWEIIEPDPDTATTVRYENAYPWSYPDGSYNTEASFMAKGYLVLVTKTSPHARMYRFDTLTPGVNNKPKYLGQLGNSKDVSVVRQSHDGRYLVSASHELVRLYRSTDGSGSLASFGGRLPDCEFRAFPGDHVEAGEFAGEREMVFLDEVKKTFRLRLAP